MKVVISLIIAASVLFSACKKSSSSAKMPPLEVEVATAQLNSLYDQISFATTIQPLYSATIEPRVSGYLTDICYGDGEIVKRGAPLFNIDQSSYSASLLAAQAQQQQAMANYSLAKRNYYRAIPLAKIEAISQMDLDEYKSSYDAAEADLNYAKQQVVNDRLNLEYTTIAAPIAGVVASSTVKEGDFVGVGTKFAILTTIDYLDTVVLSLPIPTAKYLDYNRVRSYDNTTLLSDIKITLADSKPYDHLAEYYYTKQASGTNASTMVIVARAPNPDQLLKSGMFARVKANIGEKRPRVVIPQRAVNQMQGINSVWIVGSDSTVSLRPISLGSTYGDMWAVESGVEAGEMVLLTGQLKVRQGSKVTPHAVQKATK